MWEDFMLYPIQRSGPFFATLKQRLVAFSAAAQLSDIARSVFRPKPPICVDFPPSQAEQARH